MDLYCGMGLDPLLRQRGRVWNLRHVDAAIRGKLKAFASCQGLISEYRIYRRDDKGRVVKKNDHLMDASRYLARTGRDLARCKPADKQADNCCGVGGWMAERAGSSRRGKRNCPESRAMLRTSAHSARIMQRLCPGASASRARNALMRKICADADIAGHPCF